MSKLAKAHERTFGVEIECGNELGYREVQARMQRAGFTCSGSYANGAYNVGSDGSGVEVRTPILQGREGFRELKRVMAFLKSINSYVTQSDGMHVHHGAPELMENPALCLRLVDAFRANRQQIVEMVSPERRSGGPYSSWDTYYDALTSWVAASAPQPNPNFRPNSRYADERSEVTIPNIRSMPSFSRCDLNISALREHGTVEWRLHEGSLNYDQARAWIMFAQKFMHAAIGGTTVVSARTRAELLQRVRLTKKEREILDEKIVNGQFPPRGMQYRG